MKYEQSHLVIAQSETERWMFSSGCGRCRLLIYLSIINSSPLFAWASVKLREHVHHLAISSDHMKQLLIFATHFCLFIVLQQVIAVFPSL